MNLQCCGGPEHESNARVRNRSECASRCGCWHQKAETMRLSRTQIVVTMAAVVTREVTIAANISVRAWTTTRSLSVRATNADFISLTAGRSLLRFIDHK